MRKTIFPVIAASGALACGSITGDLNRVIAIELSGNLNRSLLEGSTLLLTALALDASGDSVPGTEIIWRILDVDSLGTIGFTLDSLTGLVTGIFPSSARVQARADNLRSGPLTVTVTAAPDSLAALSDTILTFSTPQTRSPAMLVQVFDLTTTPGEVLGLGGITVRYSLPGGALTSAFLTLSDSATGDGAFVEAETTGAGNAQAFLALVAGVPGPDTVMVEASVLSATSAPIPGSPIRFTVIFAESQ